MSAIIVLKELVALFFWLCCERHPVRSTRSVIFGKKFSLKRFPCFFRRLFCLELITRGISKCLGVCLPFLEFLLSVFLDRNVGVIAVACAVVVVNCNVSEWWTLGYCKLTRNRKYLFEVILVNLGRALLTSLMSIEHAGGPL